MGLTELLRDRILPLTSEDGREHMAEAARAVLAEPSCVGAGREVFPGGLVVGCAESDVWIPALLTHTELKVAVDKDSAAMLVCVLEQT
eukprot:scaffold648039_cov31-Prasinocladus_malaysianus.AAC.1